MALGLGWWTGVSPLASLGWHWRGLAVGIAATAPLLLGLWWCRRTRFGPVSRLVAFVEDRVAPIFGGCGPAQLALVAATAGVGEELLFRGVLQPLLAAHVPPWTALILVGTLFGVVHWLTTTYAVLASIVGIYLGALFHLSGNLLVPIATHALYDFVALILLARVKQTSPPSVL